MAAGPRAVAGVEQGEGEVVMGLGGVRVVFTEQVPPRFEGDHVHFPRLFVEAGGLIEPGIALLNERVGAVVDVQQDGVVAVLAAAADEFGDKLDAGDKEKIEAALKDVEEALKGDDKAAIDDKNNALMAASQKLGEPVHPGGIIMPRRSPMHIPFTWTRNDIDRILDPIRHHVALVRKGIVSHVPESDRCKWCHTGGPDVCLPQLRYQLPVLKS